MTTPTIFLIVVTVAFLIWERVLPGRSLPNSTGWYFRALSLNFAQMVITLLTGKLWVEVFMGESLLDLSGLGLPAVEGFIAWFVGTFIFYWWHRLRHQKGFWLIFHQMHHSVSRIEVLTSFYKHPIEMFVNTFLAAVILFPILGVSVIAAPWYNFFAALGEYFYHSNVKTPRWLRYFVQTPELHSIHHQFNVHSFNYSDLPIWDRLFGTYRDMDGFVDRCGFPRGAEQKLLGMLAFKEMYKEQSQPGYGGSNTS